MAKEDTLTLFPEVEEITQDLTDQQLGILIRALFAHHYRSEAYTGDDLMIKLCFRFISNQLNRRDAFKKSKSDAAKKR